MAFNVGDIVPYNFRQADYASQFGPVAPAVVTRVNSDGTAYLTIFPCNAAYSVTRLNVAEGTDLGQASASSTQRARPVLLDIPDTSFDALNTWYTVVPAISFN